MARAGGEPREAQRKWDGLKEYRAKQRPKASSGVNYLHPPAPAVTVKVFKDWNRLRRCPSICST